MKQSMGELYREGNPVSLVDLPEPEIKDSAASTLRLSEAAIILKAARLEAKDERRWLPWMCAYSGARINEVAQLTAEDFFQLGDDWFYRINTAGQKQVKGKQSIRQVPVHPHLIEEGLMDFVLSRADLKERMFVRRSAQNLSDWIRNDLKLTRKEMRPNHGWRHLFEDKALVAGMQDAAKKYITGRTSGSSDEGYGKSEAMLPGLAAQMRRVERYL